jgi:hypothetical protein
MDKSLIGHDGRMDGRVGLSVVVTTLWISIAFLKEKEVHVKIKHIWSISLILPFFGKIYKCIEFYKLCYIQRTMECR